MAAEHSAATALAPGRAPAVPSIWDRISEAVSPGNYRPTLRPDLTWARLQTRRGRPYTMLADRPRKYLRLTQRDDFLAGRMDGTRSVSDLVVDYFHRFGRFAFDRVASLVGEFRKAGFLTDPPKDIYGALRVRLERPVPVRPRRWEGTPLRLRLPLRGLDPLVTRVHDRVGWIFFTRPMVLGSIVVTVLGIAALVAELRGGRDPFAPLGTSHLAGVAALIVAYYAAVFVHESAHALTCKHFGGHVDEAGFMLYYLVPAFYVNVTDSWLAPWRRRIAVFWAGPYSGFVLASVSAIAVFLLPGGLVSNVLFKLSVVFYINSAFNLHTSRHIMRLMGRSDDKWRKYLFY